MDAAERALLATTVGDALANAPTDDAAAVDGVLARLGWLDMLAAEPSDAIAVVFGALGLKNASATVHDDVIAHALGIEPRPDLAVLFPSLGAWQVPGRFDGRHVRARGLSTSRCTAATEFVVVGRDHTQLCAGIVQSAAATSTRVRGMDPDAGLYAVEIDAGATVTPIAASRWDDAVALARRALAHQTAGASHAMLDLARTHAVERVQFGRPIAHFQAVRHRLADALVAIEALDATLGAAADTPTSPTAALAKAVAGRTARTVAAHCQQVLAGVGFTTDHAFHRYLKRTIVLEGLFGSADDIALDIGRALLRTRTVPTLIEL
jgi:Acyl-CoA dehydrogenase, C-terminal domain